MITKASSSIFNNVYNSIKTKILNLEFKPGKVISVASLADALHVSRTPIHDALMKLSSENLIDIFPKSGSRVSLIDIKRTADERFIRKALELSAVKEMFYNYDETYLKVMEECIEKHEKACKAHNLIETLHWDSEFHLQIFKCIKREYCYRVLTYYSANEYRVRLLAEKAIASTQESILQNHRDIVTFIRKRNLEAVIEIEEQHLNRISTEITTLVAAFPSLFATSSNIAIPPRIRTKEDYDENFLETITLIS